MSDTIKGSIIGALITVVGSILVFVLGNFSTQSTIEEKTVETLSGYFDSVDKDMSYEQALQTIYKENENLKIEISNQQSQIDALNQQIIDTQQKIEQQSSSEEISRIIGNATEYWNNSDFTQALSILKTAKSISPDIQLLYEQYSDEYISNLLLQANELVYNNKRSEAIDLLKTGVELVYDNQILNNRIDEINNNQPIKISDLEVFYENSSSPGLMHFENLDGEYKKDNLSNIHNSGLLFSVYAEANLYREYMVDQKYSTLNALFSITYPSRSDHTNAYICIYGDDELIYQSDIITGGVEPIQISNLDISNVKKLKIEINSSNAQWSRYALYDCILNPK